MGSAAGTSARKVLGPTAQTGSDGRARFDDLAPGLWNVRAGLGDDSSVSTGVVVQAGRTRTYTVSVRSRPGAVAFRALTPAGLPPALPDITLHTQMAGETPSSGWTVTGGGWERITLDKEGGGHYAPPRAGLWRLTPRFRGSPDESIPLTSEPFDSGDALVAVSPTTPLRLPVVVRTTRHRPGRIRVRLEDASGNPLRGTAFIGRPLDAVEYAASVDARGVVVFPDLPSGSYPLTASAPSLPAPPPLGRDGEPFPSDAALTGVRLFAPQAVVVRSDKETTVTFRPQPLGYVRGRVAVPAPDLPKNYAVFFPYYSDMLPTFRNDPQTGEFVGGPFPPGLTTLKIQRITPEAVDSAAFGKTFPVIVAAGRVRRVTAPIVPAGGFPSVPAPPLSGTVLLADGKTPAWGARAALFVPQDWPAVRTAWADARGRLTEAAPWYLASAPEKPPPGGPYVPTLVAWLPGANGAAIVPYQPGQDARLVLPAPVSLRGRVTVGGQPVMGLPSGFRVKAAYQGRGALNEVLSVEATAQADGTFELAGLTPGTYRVQAARDEVWLSPTQTLTVGAGALPDLTLDIAPPGLPVVLHLEDKAGRPLAGRQVGIARPDGPLTDQIWPAALASDGAGDLRVDGLEAGPHRLTLSGLMGKSVNFDVPVWTADAPIPVRRIVIGR